VISDVLGDLDELIHEGAVVEVRTRRASVVCWIGVTSSRGVGRAREGTQSSSFSTTAGANQKPTTFTATTASECHQRELHVSLPVQLAAVARRAWQQSTK
jgi:hypothetical protein